MFEILVGVVVLLIILIFLFRKEINTGWDNISKKWDEAGKPRTAEIKLNFIMTGDEDIADELIGRSCDRDILDKEDNCIFPANKVITSRKEAEELIGKFLQAWNPKLLPELLDSFKIAPGYEVSDDVEEGDIVKSIVNQIVGEVCVMGVVDNDNEVLFPVRETLDNRKEAMELIQIVLKEQGVSGLIWLIRSFDEFDYAPTFTCPVCGGINELGDQYCQEHDCGIPLDEYAVCPEPLDEKSIEKVLKRIKLAECIQNVTDDDGTILVKTGEKVINESFLSQLITEAYKEAGISGIIYLLSCFQSKSEMDEQKEVYRPLTGSILDWKKEVEGMVVSADTAEAVEKRLLEISVEIFKTVSMGASPEAEEMRLTIKAKHEEALALLKSSTTGAEEVLDPNDCKSCGCPKENGVCPNNCDAENAKMIADAVQEILYSRCIKEIAFGGGNVFVARVGNIMQDEVFVKELVEEVFRVNGAVGIAELLTHFEPLPKDTSAAEEGMVVVRKGSGEPEIKLVDCSGDGPINIVKPEVPADNSGALEAGSVLICSICLSPLAENMVCAVCATGGNAAQAEPIEKDKVAPADSPPPAEMPKARTGTGTHTHVKEPEKSSDPAAAASATLSPKLLEETIYEIVFAVCTVEVTDANGAVILHVGEMLQDDDEHLKEIIEAVFQKSGAEGIKELIASLDLDPKEESDEVNQPAPPKPPSREILNLVAEVEGMQVSETTYRTILKRVEEIGKLAESDLSPEGLRLRDLCRNKFIEANAFPTATNDYKHKAVSPKTCPKCSDEVEPDAKFCGSCGFELSLAEAPTEEILDIVPEPAPSENQRKCPRCETLNNPSATHCKNCRKDLREPPPEATVGQTQAGNSGSDTAPEELDESRSSLSEIFEKRQIKYMLGKIVSKDILAKDDDPQSETIANKGDIIDEEMIKKAKAAGQFLELSLNIEIET